MFLGQRSLILTSIGFYGSRDILIYSRGNDPESFVPVGLWVSPKGRVKGEGIKGLDKQYFRSNVSKK